MMEPSEPWVLVFCIFNWFIMKINQVEKTFFCIYSEMFLYYYNVLTIIINNQNTPRNRIT